MTRSYERPGKYYCSEHTFGKIKDSDSVKYTACIYDDCVIRIYSNVNNIYGFLFETTCPLYKLSEEYIDKLVMLK